MASLIGCHQFLTSPRVKEWLKEQWIHLKLYETRVVELKDVVEKLKKVRDKIQHKVDEEEHRHGRGILVEVEEWIERARLIFDEYEDFNKDDTCHDLAVFHLLDSGYLPKPGIRFRRSRKAYDITRNANELLQTATFDSFSYWSGPPSMATFFSNVGYESFPSREETKRKIIEELEKPNVRRIGFHGLSGVGKTTLVKEVVKEALEKKMFDVVTMASVTRNPDIRKIQGQIVDMLGVILDEESDIARAARIQKILKNEKKSTLIILDDLWEKLDFNMLGIPYEIDNDDGLKNVKGKSLHVDGLKNIKEGKSLVADDLDLENVKEGKYPIDHGTMKGKKLLDAADRVKTEETLSRYKGCKILMISESKQVLLSQMEGRANSIFSVKVLKEKEAEMLFKKMAGIGDKNSEFEKLAAQIANKCKGLPMSIVTTARALKYQSRSIWEDTHRKLEWQKLTGAPEFSTKLSYDLLEDEELKYTFLICAWVGHDALIMDLVKYCIGLGFLQGIYTVRQTRDRVYALVAKLKESGLLSGGYSSDHFTMQDTVRSAALSIAYKENHLFTMTKGKIDEWPDKLERYAAISLNHCDFVEEFPGRINNRRLRFFQVINNDPRLKIPKNFFKGMKELKVLILIGIHLSLIDSSISSLRELRMLCLEQCILDKDLSIIGKLEKLRILSFSGSDVEKLPVELKQLKKLQIFDISNCSKLKEIPSGVISSLVSLEELYMRNTLIQWEIEELTRQSKIALLSELKHLNHLTTLDIQIPNVSYLPKNLFFDKLYSYKIVIGDLSAYLETDFKMPEKYETLRFLAIRLEDFDIHSLKEIKMMFESVEILFLEELNIVQKEDNIVHDIFYRLNLKGFPYLKNLLIVNNSTIQSLIHPEDRERQHPEKAFPKLESLYLYNLKKMDNICSCELSEPSFGKLKVIKINLCGQLKNVFSISVVRLLTVLETVEVSECNSLKEIVPVETQSNTPESKLMFPELRSLKLQSLPEFIGFDPISSIEGGHIPSGEEKKFFHEKVEVSKLERMELSSVQIDIIWSDQPALRSSFENLTHLDVNGCWNLKYLISFSMAESLVSLQSLFVSDCEKMTSIFPQGRDILKMKGGIFPKLKNIKLRSMKSLSKIWNSKLSDSFNKLDTLIIEECDKLVNVFPCYMEGVFRSLCNLRVTNCRSMQAIFDIDDRKQDVGHVANLQDVHLETLPKLEYVWELNKNRGGILNLNNLQKLWVRNCYSLENIFPFSVVKCLDKLEYLAVCDCLELREIVSKREAANTDNLSFDFPKLSTIKFSELPRFTSFYPGAYDLSCPKLNNLSIEHCDNLEPFNKKEPVLFPEKVINKLKSMQIESWHAKSPNSYMREGNHRRDNLEELCLSRLMDTEILYSFLHRNPYLKSLSLNNCFFEEIVPLEILTRIEKLGVVPKLKSLKLIDLPKLKEIGFEPDIILKRIEFLILKNCPCMITVLPSLASLTHLTNLEVVNCDGLENLMSPSTAKSLGQLNTMKVIKCESLMEIVGREGENDGKVLFKQLKALELVSLKNLKSFCCSKSCVFEFPSLEKLVVSACYNMETFSEKVTSSSTPILQKIYVVHEKKKKRCCWEGDLNATIQKIFKEKKYFEGMEEMSLSEHRELQEAWQQHGVLQKNWFYSLKILKLENCEIHPYAIPSNILPYLKSLKELEVRDCFDVEVIFEMDVTEGAGTTFQLQKLTLHGLCDLMHVWEMKGEGTHSFQNLQQVFVENCHNLQTVFPAAVAKNLKKLNKLEIGSCHGLHEIVGKEEDAAVDETQKFVFPCLTTLHLYDLPELLCFCPESFTLECPVLNQLSVTDCQMLKQFEIKDISNLEELALDWKHALVLGSKLGEVRGNLKYLNNIRLFFEVDENEKPILPIEILEKALNLKKMSTEFCHCLEIDIRGMPTRLKTLTLNRVGKLQSIVSEDSAWLNMICDKIHEFNVIYCPDLTTLMHSTSIVSFSHVRELYISGCHGLKYLFTSSAANNLKHLEHIQVWDCKSIKEIVAREQVHPASGSVELEKLYRIDLNYLSSLECFYSGDDILQLPSLIQVDIWKCPMMEIFSQGSILVNSSFRGIQASNDSNDELVFYDDLNASVKKVVLLQDFFEALHDNCSVNNLDVQADWLGKMATLKLGTFSLPSVIPYGILSLLRNLKELEVRDSDQVEVIFYMKEDTEIVETTSQLKKLTLQGLSKLKHVWERNSEGVLIFGNLQEVVVSDCENLQTLFPASLAKNHKKLEKLEIKCCVKLQEIVEKEEGTANETEKFVFPRLEKLDLGRLPQLTSFYPQTFTVECPALNKLSVVDCDRLELFQSAHLNRQPLISNPKVISNLKELSLDWKHISALSLWFKSEQFAEDLNYLNEISLFFDADENEKAMLPIEILQKAPNLIEMSINKCNDPEIFLAQNPKVGEDRMLEQLKILTLDKVSKLQSIESEEDSSWLNTICEKLHELNVFKCPHLITLVHSTSTVSFSCLKEVFISECADLQYLFTSSAAKKLMNLEKITVKECETVKEIVDKEGDETSQVIKFERLHTIVLDSLPSLICFYSGSDILQLSSLITGHIRQCRNMKIFSQGVIYADSFRGVQMSLDPKQDLFFHQDLNATIKGMFPRLEFFEALDLYEMHSSDNTGLRADLHNVGLQNKWLCNLGALILKLDKCILPYAIPSGILPHLKNLKELEVQDSGKVEVIFDMNDTEIMETASQLKKLTLHGLYNLVRVWGKNRQGVLIFGNLQEVVVSHCGNLRTLFPTSLAKNLKELKKLEIKYCGELHEIVEKEEGTAANVAERFVFPHLESLDLYGLHQLTCFYPQTFTLECPALNKLSVLDCHGLGLFQSAHPKGEDEGTGISINRRPLVSNLKDISNLKELRLDWKHISALSSRFRSGQFMKGFKYLNEISLFFHADENEKAILPIEILQKAPNLVKMSINKCNDLEIFLAQNSKVGEDGMLGQLKILTLDQVSVLQSIGAEDSSWLNTICEKLHELNVDQCPHLTTLVHTVSFSRLKKVSIFNCPKLQYLFTYSAAKKLMNLEEIRVGRCRSVKEIVAKEGDEDEHKQGEDKYENEMIFGKLQFLTLDSLPKFESFYMGSSTLNFPSLKEVQFTQCPSMKIFRLGDKVPAEFKVAINRIWVWKGAINSVIMQ